MLTAFPITVAVLLESCPVENLLLDAIELTGQARLASADHFASIFLTAGRSIYSRSALSPAGRATNDS